MVVIGIFLFYILFKDEMDPKKKYGRTYGRNEVNSGCIIFIVLIIIIGALLKKCML